MISLIQNELKKIFKKKGLIITLLVTLAFIILTNVIYKIDFDNSYDYIGEEISFYEEQLKNIDPNTDKELYSNYRSELDIFKLMQKYGQKSWQAQIIQSEMRSCIYDINYYIYQEKNEEELKVVKAQYDEYIKRLDTDDWRYFAEKELKEKEAKIKALKELQEKTTDKLEIKELQNQIRGYEISRQIATWRLEKQLLKQLYGSNGGN